VNCCPVICIVSLCFGVKVKGPIETSVLLTRALVMVTVDPPAFVTVTLTELLVHPHGVPTSSCSAPPMNMNDRAPIHAATAMLTATVTAMSMIDATTGLRAFLLFNIFISFLSLLLGLLCILEEKEDLNLTT